MRSDIHFANGTTIEGKWLQHQYCVKQRLGEGANGKVYLVERDGHTYALKLGFSAFDLQSEINVLRLIENHRTGRPYFIEADDVHFKGKDLPYYIMSYVNGLRIDDYIAKHGHDWFYIIGRHILGALCHLHQHGWVFGDLNINNVLITDYGGVELIDYGGVTQKGRAIKQFTELNDRGFWQAGSRTADEQYDLFAFAILCLQCLDERASALVKRDYRHVDVLLSLCRTNPHCRPLLPFFEQALGGQFQSSQQACALWRHLILHREMKRSLQLPVKWLRGAFLASAAMFAATVYYVFL